MENKERRRLRMIELKKEKPDFSDNFYMELDCENLQNLY